MRVISGSAKGIHLSSVPGKGTRPITDRVKEALFNILGPDIVNARFLDLFGGTGAVGIEALSRGAECALFLEINYRAYKVIQKNLQVTGFEPYATVLKKDAFVYLQNEPDQTYDYIYIAPPQYRGMWIKTIAILDQNPNWLKCGAEIIIQIHPKELENDINYTNFMKFDQRNYGDTLLLFYERVSTKHN